MRLRALWALVLFAAPASLPAMPIQVGHAVVLQAKVNGTGPWRFCLDTGLGGEPAVSAGLAAKLKLPAAGTTTVSDPSGQGAMQVALSSVDSMTIGEAQRRSLRVSVQDAAMSLPECDGVVGLSFFEGYVVTIDFPAQQLVLSHEALRPNADCVMPVVVDHGVPSVAMLAEGRLLRADIDTMSPGLRLPQAVAEELKFSDGLRPVGMARTVSGVVPIQGGVVDSPVLLAGYDFRGSFVEVNSRFATAGLGIAALRPFIVTFDLHAALVRFVSEKKEIRIAPPRMRPMPQMAPMPMQPQAL
jgi:hypothetical protein